MTQYQNNCFHSDYLTIIMIIDYTIITINTIKLFLYDYAAIMNSQ